MSRHLLLAILPVPAVAVAQQAAPLTPPGWTWRTDIPASPQKGGTGNLSDAVFEFTPMAPGWHITMGPGGTLFDPAARAEGRFVIEGELILFPGSTNQEYGVFVGGSALDGPGARWFAFVVREDGGAAVLRHDGGRTTELLPWGAHAAVKPRERNATVKNIVTVRAEPDSVRFLVNGERIGAWARAEIPVDGTFGFRIGRGVNLHITNLDHTRRLAPFPTRR